tara:strand:- start:1907 stop:2137 length:231 start_codon:yes stop_codon:yes gene_type:complete
MEIVKRSDGMYNVWEQHNSSWYDHEFSEWLEESDNGHDPKIWVVTDVLTPEQAEKELVDFVQNADGPVTFEFTLEE